MFEYGQIWYFFFCYHPKINEFINKLCWRCWRQRHKVRDNEALTWVLLFCMCCSLNEVIFLNDTTWLSVVQLVAFACLEPISFLSNSLFLLGELSPPRSVLASGGREQGSNLATWHSLLLVSAIHLGKDTGSHSWDWCCTSWQWEASLVQVADMVECEHVLLLIFLRIGIFLKMKLTQKDNRVRW